MKRLAVFCDGTWNRLSATYPTNVVLAAQAVLPSAGGIPQIVYYNEGVGTSSSGGRSFADLLAGAFGFGLFQKIAEAYRFIVFNYEPGDEIYIFGFSRGAYTARSLAGLIRKCGIIGKTAITSRIADAFAFYRDPNVEPDHEPAQEFRADNSYHTLMKELDRDWRRMWAPAKELDTMPLFNIKYVGVWDTVGALGIPKHLLAEIVFRTARRYQFHDTRLSSVVESARHAVAIDETRRSFEPALWENLPVLNDTPGRKGNYEQLWFPGDHGSVGGGGDVVGLSRAALLWIMAGAERAGLVFDPVALTRFQDEVDPYVSPRNVSGNPGIMDRFIYLRGMRTGIASPAELSQPTLDRIAFRNRGRKSQYFPYHPAPLKHLAESIPDWETD